ncbi:MAG: winged helix DNA-binding domain-containing protein [Solirubrobacteraceae bacterium]
MSAERVLSARELNRALLARQLLLERSPAAVPQALERVGGLQAQYAPSMYVGLWSRTRDFGRDDLRRLLERRAVVQATLMRVTIHLVARGDYWPFALAVREARRAWWLRARRGAVSADDMAAAAERVRERLEVGETVHRKELEELVGREDAVGVGLWIDLVRVPPSGTWERRRADLFAAADAWIGPPDVTAEEGVEQLVRRYLAGFGPASRADIQSYTGLPRSTFVPALERMALRRFRSESGEELLDVPRAPLPDPQTPAPVRFLPTWDATLLVHTSRTGILPEEHRSRIFSSRNPHSLPTFLVDGAVAGAWRHTRGRIELEPFRAIDGATQRALREEADRLAALHA